jgi:hypothetical protein
MAQFEKRHSRKTNKQTIQTASTIYNITKGENKHKDSPTPLERMDVDGGWRKETILYW